MADAGALQNKSLFVYDSRGFTLKCRIKILHQPFLSTLLVLKNPVFLSLFLNEFKYFDLFRISMSGFGNFPLSVNLVYQFFREGGISCQT